MKNYFAAGEHRFASTALNPNRNKPFSEIRVPVKQKCYGLFNGLAVMATNAIEARRAFNELRRDAANAEMSRIYGDIDAATKAAKAAQKAAKVAAKEARQATKAARQAEKAAPVKTTTAKAAPVTKTTPAKTSPATTPAQRAALHSAWLDYKNSKRCK